MELHLMFKVAFKKYVLFLVKKTHLNQLSFSDSVLLRILQKAKLQLNIMCLYQP